MIRPSDNTPPARPGSTRRPLLPSPAERAAAFNTASMLAAETLALDTRLQRLKATPGWLGDATHSIALLARSLAPSVEAWHMTADDGSAFRPSNTHILGYVALMMVFVVAYNWRDPVVDLSTPCLAYNLTAADHGLEQQRCDAWGQFDFPQTRAEIEETIVDLRELQGAE